MITNNAPTAAGRQDVCPFLQMVVPHWSYRILGYCGGVRQGLLMIPSTREYRDWCSTAAHTACPIYRSRRVGEVGRTGKILDAADGISNGVPIEEPMVCRS